MKTNFEIYIANAIRWAQEHLGATEYATRCLAFVEDAYEESNHVEIFGGSSAQESADEYGAAQNRGEPPIGAFVFYACAGPVGDEIKNWGHVGLCIGEGKVIHALDKVRIDALSRRAEPHARSRVGRNHSSLAGRRSSASLSVIARSNNQPAVWRLHPMIV